MNFLLAIAPLMGLIVQIITTLIITKLYSKNSLWRDLFLGFCAGFLFTLVMTIVIFRFNVLYYPDIIGILCVNSLSLVALCFCYFNFVNLNYTSLRIRLLKEFIQSGGKLSLPEILKKYDAQIILNARLSRLIKAKELFFDGKYYIPGNKSRFTFISIILKYFKNILKINSTIHSR